ncbi:SGNH/GDSL hydrolase family protein [Leifsonia sp. F6_8S_P_1B]|uniref:SGNH/GDSL hydrolase family protein n=1 Tax=Leifsonia williamsii TaxID=3035919 RepID=A0ABT8K8X2_9MICO|nr:SGNH/GDSL hydrolase family protein [Leifsonia williamsii]MDN4613834.1 SGNH/GDSL hydrolase family protein [Leifsonia williamsii]
MAAQPAHADPAASTSRITGPWVTNNGRGASLFEAVGVPTAGAPIAGVTGPSVDAVRDRAATWSFPAVGSTGPVMYGTGTLALCLTGAAGVVHAEACVQGRADQQYAWDYLDRHDAAKGYGIGPAADKSRILGFDNSGSGSLTAEERNPGYWVLWVFVPTGAQDDTTATDLLTPVKPIHYVAMGDSYASGLGTRAPLAYGNFCFQSPEAYSALLATAEKVASYTSVACAQAVSNNIDESAQTFFGFFDVSTGPQLEALKPDTNLVTLSIGGNDLNFAQILIDCAFNEFFDNPSGACVGSIEAAETQARSAEFHQRLVQIYTAVKARVAPDARVLVIDYPRLFTTANTRLISDSSRARMNAAVDVADEAIRSAAAEAGVTFVDVRDRFMGHGAMRGGSPNAWINDVDPLQLINIMHPTAAGHAQGYLPAIEAALQR